MMRLSITKGGVLSWQEEKTPVLGRREIAELAFNRYLIKTGKLGDNFESDTHVKR